MTGQGGTGEIGFPGLLDKLKLQLREEWRAKKRPLNAPNGAARKIKII